MVKTGSAYWAILLAGTALLSIVWAGTSEVTVILALLAGYFLGISSPESKMNAEFARHLNNNSLHNTLKEHAASYSRGLLLIPEPDLPKEEE